ncbi:MAG: XRE family transcriptional regulator [Rhodospirillaceae bacterium]|nr:MAG: XRE family transcriptional regulator [Rhodospirillaceae bacterium]
MPRETTNKVFAGPRLRRLRRDLGLNQAQMAQGLDISPSYLNLLERNQRPLSAQLLLKLADSFDVNLKGLSGDEGGHTLSDLKEVFSDPLLEGVSVPAQDLIDLAGTSPAVARAVIELYRGYRQTVERTAGLAEKMTDGSADTTADTSLFPAEDVRDFVVAHRNHFPELEQAAEALWEQSLSKAETLAAGLRQHLKSRHSIAVQIMPVDFMGQLIRRFDRHSSRLFLSEALPPPTRVFQIAYQICMLEHGERLEEIVARSGVTQSETRRLLRISLAGYFAGAVLMPYEKFLRTAEKKRYDIELLCQRFDASYEQVCHRLTTLQRPGAPGVPFFFLRVDPAGNISKRLSAGGFHFARYGGACPRWNVHEAFRNPGKIVTQVIEMPDKTRYFSTARTVDGVHGGYNEPLTQYAIGLGCEISQASRLVYADPYDLDALKSVTEIGLTCRLCERIGCSQRAFPPMNRSLIVDEGLKTVSPYMFHSQE